jgi:hypothetical protein
VMGFQYNHYRREGGRGKESMGLHFDEMNAGGEVGSDPRWWRCARGHMVWRWRLRRWRRDDLGMIEEVDDPCWADWFENGPRDGLAW